MFCYTGLLPEQVRYPRTSLVLESTAWVLPVPDCPPSKCVALALALNRSVTRVLHCSQVDRLRDEFHIYITRDGRVSMAGINKTNVQYVAKAFHSVSS